MKHGLIAGIDPGIAAGKGTTLCIGDTQSARFEQCEAEGEDDLIRMVHLKRRVTEVLDKYGVEVAVLENPGHIFRGKANLIPVARVYLLEACFWRGVPVVEVSPAQLKQFATGKGNADKDTVAAAVQRQWGQLTGGERLTHDQADALCLMVMGLGLEDNHVGGLPYAPLWAGPARGPAMLTDYQRRVLEKLAGAAADAGGERE